MPYPAINYGFVVIYFIYGLAFFTMGISMLLETGRSPLLAEKRAVRPLAIFGILHGIHEWMEIILLQSGWLGLSYPEELAGFRVLLLAASFIPLVLFGFLVINSRQNKTDFSYLYTMLILSVFVFAAFILTRLFPTNYLPYIDIFSRYLLAIPGAILAGLALLSLSRDAEGVSNNFLVVPYRWAAVGFFIYGLTQIFVPRGDFFPANTLNSGLFMQTAGFPVQLIRAAVAVLITASLIQVIKRLEVERQDQLHNAQKARLEALEVVQDELRKRELLRKELLRHTVESQEEERSRIARELHDESAQLLTAIKLNLATLQAKMPKGGQTEELIVRLQDLGRQLSSGIYRMVRDLRPAQLDDLGLVPALQYLIDEGFECMCLSVSLDVQGQRQRLDNLVETVLYRVTQEALTNVCRHGQTDRAFVILAFEPDKVRLHVKDSGIGFNPSTIFEPPHGFGLAGMRERVESVGGKLRIHSQQGKGTLIEVEIPVITGIGDEESAHGKVNSTYAG